MIAVDVALILMASRGPKSGVSIATGRLFAVTTWLSSFSFSLYVTHMIFIENYFRVFGVGKMMDPAATTSLLGYLVGLGGLIGLAYLFSRMTEVNTSLVRKFCRKVVYRYV